MRWLLALGGLVLTLLAPAQGAAFCGFYVAGADAKLFNNATLVVMMRDGTRTVLSMQNNYQGPAEGFAMVVPVPVVLQKENVKTLDAALFDRVDRLTAPRLVEYWEDDPCRRDPPMDEMADGAIPKGGVPTPDEPVKVEAAFTVGEYDVVVLSADDSSALEGWLRTNQYAIPAGADALLEPYVASGMKFFVAKVDVSKVKMKDGMAMLSPLRFHYEDEKFRLPVRLGLVNSKGTQDLIVHVLAKTRYDVANFPNATIPTNLDLDETAKDQFGAFYAALFDRTSAKHPGAVITEYAWDASSCDPCPEPPLTEAEMLTLGADVVPALQQGAVLTRLHVRYGKDALGEDLVFRTAEPIVGGREQRVNGKLESGAKQAGPNAFQARYAIRHPWRGRIACSDGQRGRWVGPPDDRDSPTPPKAALELAFAPRDNVNLAGFLVDDVAEIGVKAERKTRERTDPVPVLPKPTPPTTSTPGACGCELLGQPTGSASLLWLFGVVVTAAMARRRAR